MSTESVLFGTAILAGVLATCRLIHLQSNWVKPELFDAFVLKCCRAGDWSRALKLCRAASDAPYCAAVGDTIKPIVGSKEHAHPSELAGTFPMRFEEAFAARAKQFDGTRWLNILAGVAVIGPAVHWLQPLLTMPSVRACLLIYAVDVLLIIAAELLPEHMRRTAAAAGAALMPKLADALSHSSTSRDAKAESPKAPADEKVARVIIQIYRGNILEKECSFDQDVIKIGHIGTAHIGEDEPSLSRMHAVIEVSADGKASIIDLGSNSGTFLKGQRVTKSEVLEGEEIHVGALRLFITHLGAAKT